MAQNDDVRCHRFKITGCVEQGLTFNDARASDRNIERVCTQTFLSDFELRTGASTRLVEEVDDGLSTERGNFFYRPRTDLLHRFGCIEDQVNFVRIQVADAEKMMRS